MLKLFLYHNNVVLGAIITTTSKSPKLLNPVLQHLFSHKFFSNTTTKSESQTHPFAVSYLINNFGFSSESALKAFNNKQVRFNTTEKPDSVITFFKNNGFSHSNINTIVKKAPWLLSSKPHNAILPKFQFFISKGVISSHIVSLLTANPYILRNSLEKRIIPLFELLSKFLKINKVIIVSLIRSSVTFTSNPYHFVVSNINLMTDFGICDSSIARLLLTRPSIFVSNDLIKSLEEVKGLGFDPSTTTFGKALSAKECMSQKLWDKKVDNFKKWGWSDEAVLEAFKRYPSCMLTSIEKVNLVMSFWVNELGWDAIEIAKAPYILSLSLEKRIIPRAPVVQFLLKKGLRKKNASLTSPFTLSDKLFIDTFIKRFEKESSYLLKLYKEKLNLAYTTDKTCMK